MIYMTKMIYKGEISSIDEERLKSGGVTAAKGFQAAGLAAGNQKQGIQQIWHWSTARNHAWQQEPFTTNIVKAANSR